LQNKFMKKIIFTILLLACPVFAQDKPKEQSPEAGKIKLDAALLGNRPGTSTLTCDGACWETAKAAEKWDAERARQLAELGVVGVDLPTFSSGKPSSSDEGSIAKPLPKTLTADEQSKLAELQKRSEQISIAMELLKKDARILELEIQQAHDCKGCQIGQDGKTLTLPAVAKKD
jgi:hypothetical protein